ncbi:hypothetical protein ACFWWC_41085 [Streptomyces sp. NPDC058642]|uniref:hypothetical protein n=1 Tax=Streptomyces sp. NPDC058642 TaxID=3346572 RepID=UPI00365EA748
MPPTPSHAPHRSERDLPVRTARTDFTRLRATSFPRPPRSTTPPDAPAADVLRIVSDSRTPVFVTVHAGGRIRYGYWRPVDSASGRGGCYVALPTDVCEELRSGGRIAWGEPVTDPSKTTCRVTLATPVRAGREEGSAA